MEKPEVEQSGEVLCSLQQQGLCWGLMELRPSRFVCLGPVVQCRRGALLVSFILHVMGTSSDVPGVGRRTGAESRHSPRGARGGIFYQGPRSSSGINKGDHLWLSLLHDERAGSRRGHSSSSISRADGKQEAGSCVVAVFGKGMKQRPDAWPAQSNHLLPATNLQFAMPKVLPCSHQALHHKPCSFPLELVDFQVEVGGLNFLLYLNHMHKAVIATAEIAATPQSLTGAQHLAHKGSRKHHPPVNSMWKQGRRMKKGTFSFLFPMEGAEGQRGSVPWPMSWLWDLRFLVIINKPELPDNIGWEETLPHLPVPCTHQSCTQTTSCACFCGENLATQDLLSFWVALHFCGHPPDQEEQLASVQKSEGMSL